MYVYISVYVRDLRQHCQLYSVACNFFKTPFVETLARPLYALACGMVTLKGIPSGYRGEAGGVVFGTGQPLIYLSDFRLEGPE